MRSVLEQLDRVGADIQRLERAVRATATEVDGSARPEHPDRHAQGHAAELGGHLHGEGAEVARARELIRLMVSRVVITPLPVKREDGRGSGPVSVTVEGELTRALQMADVQVGRVTLSGSSKATWLRNAILGFRFTIDIPFVDKRLVGGVYDDAPVVARALRFTDRPVRNRELVRQLLEADASCGAPTPEVRIDVRVRRAVEHLANAGELRRVAIGREVGYVPGDSALGDDEWRRRDDLPLPAAALTIGVEMEPPVAVLIAIGASVHADSPGGSDGTP